MGVGGSSSLNIIESSSGITTLRFHFVSSSCNPETAKVFLGVWIPVLRELLGLIARFTNKKKEQVLNELLRESEAEDSMIR